MPTEARAGDPRLVKKQVVMLKRKYAELSGRLDRLHRQVRSLLASAQSPPNALSGCQTDATLLCIGDVGTSAHVRLP